MPRLFFRFFSAISLTNGWNRCYVIVSYVRVRRTGLCCDATLQQLHKGEMVGRSHVCLCASGFEHPLCVKEERQAHGLQEWGLHNKSFVLTCPHMSVESICDRMTFFCSSNGRSLCRTLFICVLNGIGWSAIPCTFVSPCILYFVSHWFVWLTVLYTFLSCRSDSLLHIKKTSFVYRSDPAITLPPLHIFLLLRWTTYQSVTHQSKVIQGKD